MSAPCSIPRIVHQTWRTKALPPDFARFRASWAVRHPAWEHRLYDDADCREAVEAIGAPWPRIYSNLPTAIQRADLFRYLVVHHVGGVYADIDMECRRPIDALLQGAECVLSIEAHLTERRRRLLGYREPRQLANCVFAAAPGHAFLGQVLACIAQRVSSEVRSDVDVEDSTGPRMLTRVFESLSRTDQRRIRVLPQVLLVPPNLPYAVERWIAPYSRHHFAGTWKRDSLKQRSLWEKWIERDRIPPLRPARSFEMDDRGHER
jgi:mannosyltransferase OCH1-like enzyme